MRNRVLRAAALFLILAGLIEVGAFFSLRSIEATFNRRAADHVRDDVAFVRQRVTTVEAELDATADHIEARIAALHHEPARAELFALLRDEVPPSRTRGARIRTPEGDLLAWWGEELRGAAAKTYEFDATNLYIVRTRVTGRYVVESFKRVANVPGATSSIDPRDTGWTTDAMFHAGFLRQERGTIRQLIERRPDGDLWIDITPRSVREVLDTTRMNANDAAATLLSIGAIVVLLLLRNRIATVILIVLARVALLPVHIVDDPFRLLKFDLYGS